MLNESSESKKPWNSIDYLKIKKQLNDKYGASKSTKSRLR